MSVPSEESRDPSDEQVRTLKSSVERLRKRQRAIEMLEVIGLVLALGGAGFAAWQAILTRDQVAQLDQGLLITRRSLAEAHYFEAKRALDLELAEQSASFDPAWIATAVPPRYQHNFICLPDAKTASKAKLVVERLQSAIEADPTFQEPYQTLRTLKRFPSARDALAHVGAPVHDDGAVSAAEMAAIKLLGSKDFAGAHSAAQRIIESDPTSFRGHFLAFLANSKNGDEPNAPAAHVSLIRGLQQSGSWAANATLADIEEFAESSDRLAINIRDGLAACPTQPTLLALSIRDAECSALEAIIERLEWQLPEIKQINEFAGVALEIRVLEARLRLLRSDILHNSDRIRALWSGTSSEARSRIANDIRGFPTLDTVAKAHYYKIEWEFRLNPNRETFRALTAGIEEYYRPTGEFRALQEGKDGLSLKLLFLARTDVERLKAQSQLEDELTVAEVSRIVAFLNSTMSRASRGVYGNCSAHGDSENTNG